MHISFRKRMQGPKPKNAGIQVIITQSVYHEAGKNLIIDPFPIFLASPPSTPILRENGYLVPPFFEGQCQIMITEVGSTLSISRDVENDL